MKFGDWMRAKREAKGLTYRQLGQQVGLSAVYLNDIEMGHRKPPQLAGLRRICTVLDLDWGASLVFALKERDGFTADDFGALLDFEWQRLVVEAQEELAPAQSERDN